jgi:membrane fusion protein, heavy metal efflux system
MQSKALSVIVHFFGRAPSASLRDLTYSFADKLRRKPCISTAAHSLGRSLSEAEGSGYPLQPDVRMHSRRASAAIPHALALLLFWASFAACNSPKTPAEELSAPIVETATVTLTDAQLKNANLTIGLPETQTIDAVIKVNGTVALPPQNLVSVSFPFGGYIKQIKLLPGQQVRKGETLATIEDPQFIQLQQDYLTIKAKMGFLQTDLQRQIELNETKAASDKAVQTVQTELQVQSIAAKAIAQKLKLIGINPDLLTEDRITQTVSITAPIAGFVSKINVNTGKYVAPTDVLLELTNSSDSYISLTVFEKDLPAIAVGQAIVASSPTEPNKKYLAKVHLINKSVNPDHSVTVICRLDHAEPSLVPGMFLVADVKAKSVIQVAVPDDAIVRFENSWFVFVAKDAYHFEMTEVVAGQSNAGFTAIASPNAAELLKQRIVLKNAYTLLMKMKNTADE